MTAIHAAANFGHADIIELLIRAGCDMNSRDKVSIATAIYKVVNEDVYLNMHDTSEMFVSILHFRWTVQPP